MCFMNFEEGFNKIFYDILIEKWFCCGLFTIVDLSLVFFIFILNFYLWGHGKARDPNLKPARPKFGSRPIV